MNEKQRQNLLHTFETGARYGSARVQLGNGECEHVAKCLRLYELMQENAHSSGTWGIEVEAYRRVQLGNAEGVQE